MQNFSVQYHITPNAETDKKADDKKDHSTRTIQTINYYRFRLKRRRVEIYQEAQRKQKLARGAVKKLELALKHSDNPNDPLVVDILQKMRRIRDRRVVGPNWGQPRSGRRA